MSDASPQGQHAAPGAPRAGGWRPPGVDAGYDRWVEVERYLCDAALGPDAALDRALDRSERAGLPPIAVAPNHGKLLYLLARMLGAHAILELGALGGYSTIWLARALEPGGRVVTVEHDPAHAEIATASVREAGLEDRVEVRLADALAELDRLLAARDGAHERAFDMVFIDADKERIPEYFERALELTRAGGAIVVDNAVRGGAVADRDSEDRAVIGLRRFQERLAAERAKPQPSGAPAPADARFDAVTLQTVGSKGYDGFTLVRVGSAS